MWRKFETVYALEHGTSAELQVYLTWGEKKPYEVLTVKVDGKDLFFCPYRLCSGRETYGAILYSPWQLCNRYRRFERIEYKSGA